MKRAIRYKLRRCERASADIMMHIKAQRKMGGPGAEALAGGAASGAIVLVGRARLLVLPEIVGHVHDAPPRLRHTHVRLLIQLTCWLLRHLPNKCELTTVLANKQYLDPPRYDIHNRNVRTRCITNLTP